MYLVSLMVRLKKKSFYNIKKIAKKITEICTNRLLFCLQGKTSLLESQTPCRFSKLACIAGCTELLVIIIVILIVRLILQSGNMTSHLLICLMSVCSCFICLPRSVCCISRVLNQMSVSVTVSLDKESLVTVKINIWLPFSGLTENTNI